MVEQTYVARAPEMVLLIEQLKLAAAHRLPVLLTGEPGTGKSFLAELYHLFATGGRARLVRVDCRRERQHPLGQLDRLLGDGVAAPWEETTILIDDVDYLSREGQARLLAWLDRWESSSDELTRVLVLAPRLIATCTEPLERLVAAGQFMPRLLYHLNVLGFRIPPLRRRRQEVRPLVDRFARQAAGRAGCDPPPINQAILQRLESHNWPANLRQLRSMVEVAVASQLRKRPTWLGRPVDRPRTPVGAADCQPTGRNKTEPICYCI